MSTRICGNAFKTISCFRRIGRIVGAKRNQHKFILVQSVKFQGVLVVVSRYQQKERTKQHQRPAIIRTVISYSCDLYIFVFIRVVFLRFFIAINLLGAKKRDRKT